MLKWINLTRTFGVVIFKSGNTSSFTGVIIIAIQYTLTKSLACLCKTSFLVISI